MDAGQYQQRLAPYYMTHRCFYQKKGKSWTSRHGMICAEDELGLELAMTVS
jgi:hypothetical protein